MAKCRGVMSHLITTISKGPCVFIFLQLTWRKLTYVGSKNQAFYISLFLGIIQA